MAEKLKITRLLGGRRDFLGEYDTLGSFGKLGNVYAADGGFGDSALAGGMLEVQTSVELFIVANPVQFTPAPVFETPPPESGGSDGGSGSGGGGSEGGGGTGAGGDGGGASGGGGDGSEGGGGDF